MVSSRADRLTRSLTDFAKLVELFDKHGVSFVSVTQQFNTTNSMGRLTLNVLLSFAQSRALALWVSGQLDAEGRLWPTSAKTNAMRATPVDTGPREHFRSFCELVSGLCEPSRLSLGQKSEKRHSRGRDWPCLRPYCRRAGALTEESETR